MYSYITSYVGLKKSVMKYPYEEQPHILDSTIPFGSVDETFKVFQKLLCPGDKSHLVTLHLPAGTDMTDADAVNLMRDVLRDRGIDPDTVPYILARHAKTGKAHFHLLFLDRTFVGRHVVVDLSVATTQASHRRQTLAYGLPAPAYFDPKALPTFQPPIIQRRVTHTPTAKKERLSSHTSQVIKVEKARRKHLNTDLIRVFSEDQPTTLWELNLGLDRIGAGYWIAKVAGKNAKTTFATTDHKPIFLNTLGPAWNVGAIQARMTFAARLVAVRPILGLRFLLRAHHFHPTQEIRHDRHKADHAEKVDARRAHSSAARPDGDGHLQPTAVAQPFGEANQWGGGEPRQTAVPAPGRGNLGSGSIAGAGGGSRSTGTQRDGRALKSPNGWIAILCKAARQFGGRLVKVWRQKSNDRAAMLSFADGGRSMHLKSWHRVKSLSPQLSAFIAALESANATAPLPAPSAQKPADLQIVENPALNNASPVREDHDGPDVKTLPSGSTSRQATPAIMPEDSNITLNRQAGSSVVEPKLKLEDTAMTGDLRADVNPESIDDHFADEGLLPTDDTLPDDDPWAPSRP